MTSMNDAISTAVKVQAARIGKSLNEIYTELGMGRTTFWERLNGKRAWNTEEFEQLATILKLKSSWDLLKLAEKEQDINTTMGASA